jgi:peptidoglycan hydrolase-like amidase
VRVAETGRCSATLRRATRTGAARIWLAVAALAVGGSWLLACSSARPRSETASVAIPADPLPAGPSGAAAADPVAEPLPPTAGAAAADETAVAVPPPLPLVRAAPPTLPTHLRVGLQSDLATFSLACCAGAVRDEQGRLVARADRALRVEPAVEGAVLGALRLQAAALRDEETAKSLAQRLQRMADLPADARFDAGSGLYRVRVGRFRTRTEAERAQRRLEALGLPETWIVQDGEGLRAPRLRLTLGTGGGAGGEAGRVETREIAGRWLAIEPGTTPGLRVGGARYRGRLLVYLTDRGTLNLINELPLEEYLRGVVPEELGPGIYGEIEALKAQAVAARTYTVRNLGGFEGEGFDICATPRCQVYGGMEAEHPLSDRAIATTAGEVLLWAGQPIDALYTAVCGGHTENAAVVFPLKVGEPYLAGVPCVEAGAGRIATGRSGEPLPVAPLVETVQILEARGRHLRLRAPTGERAGTLPQDLLLFRGEPADDGNLRSVGEIALAPGEPARLLWKGDQLLALVSPTRAVPFTVPAYVRKFLRWDRFRTDAELRQAVAARFPGFSLRDLEVLDRGVSGRVGRLRLTGSDQTVVEVEGLEVRWTLDVPDTLFEISRASEGGRSGWRISGRGWGHGVGMCQVGAYGLARRGASHRDILGHYYRRAELARLPAGPAVQG